MLSVLALNPEFENDLDLVVSLAAGSRFACNAMLMRLIISNFFLDTLDFFGIHLVLDRATHYLAKVLKAFPSFSYWFSKDRYDPLLHNDDPSHLPYYAIKYSGGTSLQNLRFVKQVVESPSYKIRLKDFGKEENLRLYGRDTVGEIEYSNIKVKIAIFAGKHDNVVTSEDVKEFAKLLPQDMIVHQNLEYDQDHGSFLFSSKLDFMEDLIKVLNEA